MTVWHGVDGEGLMLKEADCIIRYDDGMAWHGIAKCWELKFQRQLSVPFGLL